MRVELSKENKVSTEEQKKKREKVLKVLAVLMGVFLLVGCCGVGGLMFSDNQPTATAIPKVAATVVATSAPTMESCVCEPCPTCEVCEVCPTEVPTPTPAPATEPVVFEGSGETVTDNMQLSACQKSVFSWQHGGTSNFFVDLCGVSCKSLIIAGRDDLTGEVLQPTAGGGYYLVIEAVEGPWTVTWECED